MPTEAELRLSDLARGAWPLLKRLPQVLSGYRLVKSSGLERRYSIGRILEHNARRHGPLPALRYRGIDISHAELNARANRIARLLAERGVSAGARVGILLDNRPELILSVAAIVKLGAVAVVHNNRLPAPSLAHCVGLAPGEQMIVGSECLETWQALAEYLPQEQANAPLVVADDEAGPVPDGELDLLALADTQPDDNLPQTAEVRMGDTCCYVFTSGTTGLPKAAVIRHIRWIKAMGAFGLMALGLKPGQVLYNVLPFYHNTALAVGWSSAAATGACLAIGRRFSASRYWDEVREVRADALVYIGELCRFLYNQPASEGDRDHQARAMVGNGLRPDIWMEFKRRFGIERIYELYGASEANIAFFNILNQDRTVGLCPAEYALVDCDPDSGEVRKGADGRLIRVKPGGTGLLLGKVSKSYPYDGYTDDEASEAKLIRNAFADGDCWFNTGDLLKDLGYRHARFVDRLGDTYRWRGENIATTEVEAAAMAVDGVAEAVACGIKIPGAEGRAGMLAFRPEPEADIDQLIQTMAEHFNSHLGEYAIPVLLRQVHHLDATGTFKFVKRDLVNEAFDTNKVSDPLWIRLPNTKHYQALTPTLQEQLTHSKLGY